MKRRSFFSKLASVAVAALMAPEIIKAAVSPSGLDIVDDFPDYVSLDCFIDGSQCELKWVMHTKDGSRVIADCAYMYWEELNRWAIKPEFCGK